MITPLDAASDSQEQPVNNVVTNFGHQSPVIMIAGSALSYSDLLHAETNSESSPADSDRSNNSLVPPNHQEVYVATEEVQVVELH